jgi:uncharacterized protein (TIGR02246 family)
LEVLFHPSSHAARSEQTLAEGRIMHPRSLTLMLAVVASCSSSASPSSNAQAADEAAIDAAMQRYVADIRSNDATKIASWWTEDAVYIERAAPTVRGRAELEALLKRILTDAKVTDVSVEKDEVTVTGDLAYFLGGYREVLQPRQGPVLDNRGRFLFIWKRQGDGTWKIARSVATEPAQDSVAAPSRGGDSTRARG